MDEILAYLRKGHAFYLATVDTDGNPHVRPFGAVSGFEGKLYLVTGKDKRSYAEMKQHPQVELCTMNLGDWIRVEGCVEEDDRREARAAMLEQNKAQLSGLYQADDENMAVFRFVSGQAVITSFTEKEKVFSL